ncbi:hypothetical protein Aduo_006855 [Ancylostoma duodenale]
MLEANANIAKFKYLNDNVDVYEMYRKSSVKEEKFAFYVRDLNMMFLTPHILQLPFYGEKHPRSYIYGILGSILAHELMHGFENGGVMIDEAGNIRKWLSDHFYSQFNEKASCLVKMYNESKVPLVDAKVDGMKTLDENIADNEGLKLAIKAYRKLEKKHGTEGRLETLEDFTNEQMFFLGNALSHCNDANNKKTYLLHKLAEDTHSPGMLRLALSLAIDSFDKILS